LFVCGKLGNFKESSNEAENDVSEIVIQTDAKPEDLIPQLHAILDPTEPPVTTMANVASLFYWSLDAVNWVGFYILDGDALRLGPFHGKPACTILALEEGVCAAAVREKRMMNIPDVINFDGHIACDPASRSELVVPILVHGEVWGVLDIDSPVHKRFSLVDERLFTEAAALIGAHLEAWKGRIFPA